LETGGDQSGQVREVLTLAHEIRQSAGAILRNSSGSTGLGASIDLCLEPSDGGVCVRVHQSEGDEEDR
jgi:hypothetical protein